MSRFKPTPNLRRDNFKIVIEEILNSENTFVRLPDVVDAGTLTTEILIMRL